MVEEKSELVEERMKKREKMRKSLEKQGQKIKELKEQRIKNVAKEIVSAMPGEIRIRMGYYNPEKIV